MANEIVFRRISGNSYFITIRDIEDSYKIWKPSATAAFEAWNTGGRTLADYGIAASETFGNGMFSVDMPDGINTAKRLLIEIYRQVGVSPADDDVFDGSFEMIWNGTSLEYVLDTNGRVDVGLIEGIDATTQLDSAVYTGLDTSIPYPSGPNSVYERITSMDKLIESGGDGDLAAVKAKTDNLPDDPADDSDIDAQLAALQADLTVTKKIAEADTVIDTSNSSQWVLIFKEKGTETEIMRKNLKDINGNAIAASSIIVGGHEHTASP